MLVFAFVLSVFAQAGNPIVPVPDAPSIRVENRTVVEVPPMDPQAVSDATAVANQSFIVNTVQPVPVEWTNALCSLPNFWTTTPANMTYENSDLNALTLIVQGIALVLISPALASAGLQVMYGADPHEKLGRVMLATALVIAVPFLVQAGIQTNNFINGVINPAEMCGSLIRPHIALVHPDPGSAVAAPALVIVYALVSLATLLSLLFRLALLIVLYALGPLAMIQLADEHSEHLATWYQRMVVGTIFGQVLLCIGLRAAQVMSSGPAGAAAALMALVILLLCGKLLHALSQQQPMDRRGQSKMGMAIGLLARRLILRV